MKLGIIAGCISLLVSPAMASDNTEISRSALKCWSPPRNLTTEDNAVLQIDINGRGEVRLITTIEASPSMKGVMIESISKAIEKCAPYQGFLSGDYKISVDYKVN